LRHDDLTAGDIERLEASIRGLPEKEQLLEMQPVKRHYRFGGNKIAEENVQQKDISIEGIAKAVVGAAQPEKIILFGSRARSDAKAGSDVDLLVVEKEPFGNGRSRRQEAGKIRRSLRGFSVPVDILVFSVDEVRQWQSSINHVIGRALREGKTLYARS